MARIGTGVTARSAGAIRARASLFEKAEQPRTGDGSKKLGRRSNGAGNPQTAVTLTRLREGGALRTVFAVILLDFLAPGLRVVFCGTVVGKVSGEKRHYYAGAGNDFWRLLFESGLTSTLLDPTQDSRVLEFGIGLTDLAKGVASSSDTGLRAHYDVEGFVRKMEEFKPGCVAFHGKEAAKEVSRRLGFGKALKLGTQAWTVAGRPVFVVPSASGSNRDPSRLEGKASRLDWFSELRSRLRP